MALWHWILGGAAAYLGVKALGGSKPSRTPTIDDLNAITVAFQTIPANLNLGNSLTIVYEPTSNTIAIKNGVTGQVTREDWSSMLAKMGQNAQGVPMYSGSVYAV